MIEYSTIVKQKVNQYYRERWHLRDYRNGWMKGECPECGKHKFGIKIDTLQANCFSCGNKYNALKYIMYLEGLETKPQLYTLLKDFEGVAFLEAAPEIRDIVKVKLPQSFKLLALGNSQMGDMARNYMKKRGFNINTLTAKGIGYCTEGPYSGFIILPFYQQNKLVYFTARRYILLGGEKFKNPSVDDFGIGKSMITYNIDALDIYQTIAVVESVTNSMTWGDNSIAIIGKKASNYQISAILRSPVKSVIIGLDSDAMIDAVTLGLKLVQFKRVKVIKFPDKKDINDLGKKESKKLAKATPWMTYQDLFKLKLKYEERSINTY